jgi:hypothetical protein
MHMCNPQMQQQHQAADAGLQGHLLVYIPADAVPQQQCHGSELQKAQVGGCGEAWWVNTQCIHCMLEEKGDLGCVAASPSPAVDVCVLCAYGALTCTSSCT